MYEKQEAGLCVKQFVIFIEKQTKKNVKRLQLNQGQEFNIQVLKSQTKKKKIKVELTLASIPDMNGIAKRINGFVASKARCLLLNTLSKIGL